MTTPIQRPASNSTARKRAGEVSLDANLAQRLGEMVAALDTPAPVALPGYFVAPDVFNDVWLWRERGDYPVPILARHDLRDDLDVWERLTHGCEVRP